MAFFHTVGLFFQDRYRRFGHYPGLKQEEQARIKLIHLFLWGALVFSVLTGSLALLLDRPALTWMCFIGVAIQSAELYLIRQGHYRAVKHAFAGLFPAYLVLSTWVTGSFWLVAMLALPFVTLTMFLFRSAYTRWNYVLAYMAALALGLLLFAFGEAPYPLQEDPAIYALAVFVAMGMQVLFLNLYIDEMRLARRELLRSERKYRTLFDRAPFPLVLYEGGVITACNEASVEVLGAQHRKQLIGQKPSTFSPERQPDGQRSEDKGRSLEQRVRRKGTIRFEWLHERLDGEEVPVEVTIASVDANMEFGMWQDLRERKAQEARINDLLQQYRRQNGELEATLQRLAAEEQATQEVLENALDAVATMDEQGYLLRWNRKAEALSGIPREEAIGQRLAEILPSGRFASVLQSGLEDHARTGHWNLLNHRLEVMAKHRDGRQFPVELTVTGAKVQEGHQFTVFLRDISEQRQAEKARQRELEVAEAVNRFAQSLFHQRREEDVLWDLARNCVKGLGFRECAIYMVDKAENKLYARAAHGPNYPINLAVRKPRPVAFGEGICGSVAKNGCGEIVNNTAEDPRYIDDGRLGRSEIAVPIATNDEVLGVIDSENPEPGFFEELHLQVLSVIASLVAHRIVHLREQNERIRDLQGQRSFYEDILNGIPADIAVMDRNHRYLFLNPKAVRSAKMRRWLLGKTDFDYIKERHLPDSFANQRKAVFDRVMATGHSLHWEDRFERDGKTEVILRRLSPVLRDGEVRFVVGYGTDITRIKEAEALIQDHNKLLQAEVAARTQELDEAIEELQRSNAELESYASAASHDLQEPIRVIRQFLDLLERTQKQQLNATGLECIALAREGTERMQGMVQALLQYSRIGRDGIDTRPTDVEALVKGRVADLSRVIRKKQATVQWRHLPQDLPAEASLLGMVFYNLINNGLKFNERETPVVDIWAEESPDAWIFHIRDNGIGIPPGQEQQIFKPFKRLHDDSEFKGTGIGLASCRKIVEHHGGCIGLNSTLGEGTDFWFALPKDPQKGMDQDCGESAAASASGDSPGDARTAESPAHASASHKGLRTVPAPVGKRLKASVARLRRRPGSPGD
jgi:PAS domain S-box-containing protein